MPFDKLDKKAREAAEQYNAEYNEEAWSKMEALLDKHMPVGATQPAVKERKFHEKWLLLLLSLAAISFVVLLIKPWKHSNGNKTTQKKSATIIPVQNNSDSKSVTIKPSQGSSKDDDINKLNSSPNTTTTDNVLNPNDQNNNKNGFKKTIHGGGNLVSSKMNADIDNLDENAGVQIGKSKDQVIKNQNTFLPEGFSNQKIDNWFIVKNSTISNKILGPFSISNNIRDIKTKKSINTRKNKFANSFSISISAGPDVSAASLDNIGTFEMILGAGIGYRFGKRWQVRTGFFTAKKVYGAKPAEYNPSGMFWNYYPYLEDISADCKVNEIPVIVNYTLSQNQKQAWFASAGLSSYFMKRETYIYHSKSPSGTYWDKTYTVSGENKHYLSSLRISAGYQKTINKTVSLSAEPYLNLPLSGVGYGKVKLTSAGFLFSVNVKPFAKK